MEVNFLAVVVAGLVAMVIGALWYSPMLFGKSWMKMVGMSAKDMKAAKAAGMSKYYAIALLGQFVMAYVLSVVLGVFSPESMIEALKIGFWMWLGFIATTTISGVLWEKKPLKLYVLNNAYSLVVLVVMAGVLFKMG